jgi:hypothetical protein
VPAGRMLWQKDLSAPWMSLSVGETVTGIRR